MIDLAIRTLPSRLWQFLGVAALVATLGGCHPIRPDNPTQGEKEPEDLIDHFLCYAIDSEFKGPEVVLLDQFKLPKKNLRVGNRRLLCNPVDKKTDKHESPRKFKETHLVCYKIPEDEVRRPVTITNQFRKAAVPLTIEKAQLLCLPSGKSKDTSKRPDIPTNIDHYKCYAPVLDNLKTTKVPLKLEDQFDKYEDRKVALSLLCNPVDKTVLEDPKKGEGAQQARAERPPTEPVLINAGAHLVCYRLNIRPDVAQTVRIRNQFEDSVVKTQYPELLCLPSGKKE